MKKECKNPTCTRSATATYCSRQCQIAMRNVSAGRQIPDMWVSMDMWWALTGMAEIHNMSVSDYCLSQIEVGL